VSRPCTVLHVVAARPNFMKVAPVLRALEARAGFRTVLVHTGQHYDEAMSDAFFAELGIRPPDANLAVGSGTHAQQTAGVMTALEPRLAASPPDLVLVAGDVNSTLAAALTAAKLGIPVAHLEAGLRSGDRSMPEELNRILTDQLADVCLTPSPDADENLLREGIAAQRIHFVGNAMIDSLLRELPRVRALGAPGSLGLERGGYALVTLHRPANVDDRAVLGGIAEALEEIARRVPVVFPVHPRTAGRLAEFGIELRGVRRIEPAGYLRMLGLMEAAGAVLTDSGGIQEETTVLGVPCLTLRDTTERPITVTQGTNRLVPERTASAILRAFGEAWGTSPVGRRPDRWDGATGERVADVIAAWWSGAPSPWPGSDRAVPRARPDAAAAGVPA
jgi:UDP-N-acetylglucosamine 2-epimerase (non-hydrolysing)